MLETELPTVQDKLAFFSLTYSYLKKCCRKLRKTAKVSMTENGEGSWFKKKGDKVWLSTANLKLACHSWKLGPRYIGPFKGKRKINPVAYRRLTS